MPARGPAHFPATTSAPHPRWALLTLGAGGILGHLAPQARLTAPGLGMETRVGLLLQETARAGGGVCARESAGKGVSITEPLVPTQAQALGGGLEHGLWCHEASHSMSPQVHFPIYQGNKIR